MWSKMFDACVRCGRTAYKHVSKGLCNSCYLSDYRQSHAAELKDMKHRWYLKNVTPLAAKLKREQFHFSGMREAALQRDNYKCCDCGTTEKLVVHHTDCNGRGSKSPNNALRNLKTLCRACHINAHRVELQVAAGLLLKRAQRKLKPTRLMKFKHTKRWSHHHDKCVQCGNSDLRHAGFGLCFKCYQNKRSAIRRNQLKI